MCSARRRRLKSNWLEKGERQCQSGCANVWTLVRLVYLLDLCNILCLPQAVVHTLSFLPSIFAVWAPWANQRHVLIRCFPLYSCLLHVRHVAASFASRLSFDFVMVIALFYCSVCLPFVFLFSLNVYLNRVSFIKPVSRVARTKMLPSWKPNWNWPKTMSGLPNWDLYKLHILYTHKQNIYTYKTSKSDIYLYYIICFCTIEIALLFYLKHLMSFTGLQHLHLNVMRFTRNLVPIYSKFRNFMCI